MKLRFMNKLALRYYIYNDNQIKTIDQQCIFQDLTNLAFLKIFSNILTTFNPYSPKGLSQFYLVYLNYNNINYPDLEQLVLESNKIQSFDN